MDSKTMYFLALYIALVFLATPLHATIPIFILYCALAFSVVWTIGITPPSDEDTQQIKKMAIAIPCAIFAVMRLIPFFRWGSSALGADMGAYYANFNACFASFAACADEPIALLAYPAYALGMETQTILIIFHFIATIAIFIAIYLLAKNQWGSRVALWSATIYALSLPQFLFYWSFFLRMEIAIALSLFAIHAYTRKEWRGGIYTAFMGIIHPITLIPLMGALCAAGIADKKKTYAFWILATGAFATLITKGNAILGYAHYVLAYAKGTYEPAQTAFLAGHFVDFSFYHNSLMLFYIPFGLLVIAWCMARKKVPPIAWYAIINLCLISINAVFHNRFIIMFDIACITLAGYALSLFASRQKTIIQKSLLIFIFIMLTGYAFFQSARMEPLVNQAEFKELLLLQEKYNGMPLFINSSLYRGFVAGYTKHPVIVAPFGEKPWESLVIPSLVYNARRSTPINPITFKNKANFTRVSEHFWNYIPQ